MISRRSLEAFSRFALIPGSFAAVVVAYYVATALKALWP